MSAIARMIVAPTGNLALQFARYLVVGGVAFGVDFSLLVLLTEAAGISYRVSAALGYTVGLLVNYVLSIAWVFRDRNLSDKRAEFVLFFVIGFLGLGLNQAIVCVGTDLARLDYRAAKLVSVAVVLFWNFGARKVALFRSAKLTHDTGHVTKRPLVSTDHAARSC